MHRSVKKIPPVDANTFIDNKWFIKSYRGAIWRNISRTRSPDLSKGFCSCEVDGFFGGGANTVGITNVGAGDRKSKRRR
jgi:hypothetical protein